MSALRGTPMLMPVFVEDVKPVLVEPWVGGEVVGRLKVGGFVGDWVSEESPEEVGCG